MTYHRIHSALRRQYLTRSAADFLRYTFQPVFGLMQSIGGLGTLTTIVIVRDKPLLILYIFCTAIVIFFSAMVVSFIMWRKYKNFNGK